MIIKCVERPKEFEVVRWLGENFDEIRAFIGADNVEKCEIDKSTILINTKDDIVPCNLGDYIVKNLFDGVYDVCPSHEFSIKFVQALDHSWC